MVNMAKSVFMYSSRMGKLCWYRPVVWIIIGLVLTSMPCQAELVDRIVAIVNEDIILLSELNAAIKPWRDKLKQQGYTEVQQRIILADQQPKMLEQLIEDKLADQQIQHYAISVSDEEISNTIERIKEVNQVTDDKLMRMLEMEGLSYEAYRKQIQTQLLRTRLVNYEVKSKIVITDEDVKAYYEAHKAQYTGQTKFHLRQLLMRVVASASQEQREHVLQQMQQIHKQLEAGEDFARLAGVYSQAPSAAEGGDIGEFESRELLAQIREAIQNLKPGQFTAVLDTEQGYQIFYLEKVISAGGKTLQEATAEIEDKLFGDLVNEKYKAWLKDMRQRAHIKIVE